MTADTEWHCSAAQLDDYAAGRLADVHAWSVERHVTACGLCRRRLARGLTGTPDSALLTRIHERIVAGISSTVPDRVARPTAWRRARMLLGGASGPRIAWLLAVVCVLVISVALEAVASIDGRATPILVLVSPLLPVLGVAASYGPGADRVYEMAVATPSGGISLLLWRTIAVVGVTVPASAVAIVGANHLAARPLVSGLGPLAWLLPTVTLTVLVVGLSSVIRPARAAAVVGALWVAGVATPTLVTGGEIPWEREHRWTILVAAACVAIVVAVSRRSAYSYSYQKGRSR
jgi:hypothetical protein